MSFKVVHIVDYYIQETMNWLEELLRLSKNDIDNILAADYFSDKDLEFNRIAEFGSLSTYPPNLFAKIKSRIKHSKNIDLLNEFIISEKVDVVHFHFGHMAIRYKDIVPSVKCRKFVSLYGFDYEYLVQSKPETKQIYQQLAHQGLEFIVEGSYSKKLLESYQIPSYRIHIVQMFYERKTLVHYNQWRMPIKLFQAASYTEKKGQLLLLEALANINNNKFYQIQFNGEVVDKHYYREIQNIIQTNRLTNVKVGTKISVNHYLKSVEQSHIVVCLSKKASSGDTEGGCPVILKDAFSLAKPVFTSQHCDIPDIAIHNYNSWIIKENDVNDAMQVLNQLQKMSHKEYQYFCHSAYETAITKTKVTWTKMKLLETYYTK